MPTSSDTVTVLLAAWRAGDEGALDRLFPILYDALHGLAARQRRSWRHASTLNTTALVHEAYLKLVGAEQADFESRAHFLAVAARAMRQVLVSYARRRHTQKRGGDARRLEFDEVLVGVEGIAEDLVGLDTALDRLAAFAPRAAQVVEGRFFGGMSVEETAVALGVSEPTVKRDWAMARAWLYTAMQDAAPDDAP